MQALKKYIKNSGLDVVKIQKGQVKNPFPVGRLNLYNAYRGLPVSLGTKLKILHYISKQETKKSE